MNFNNAYNKSSIIAASIATGVIGGVGNALYKGQQAEEQGQQLSGQFSAFAGGGLKGTIYGAGIGAAGTTALMTAKAIMRK